MTNDNNTGLPELPEGFFWRVKRNDVEIRKSLPDTEWSTYGRYSIHLYTFYDDDRDQEETRRVEVRTPRTKTVKKFPRKEEVSYEDVNVVTQYRYINRSNLVVSAQTEKNGETTVIKGRYHAAEYRSRYGGYYYSYQGMEMVTPGYTEPDQIIEHRHPVTRENILSVCEKALEKFNGLELLGDYPPKTLG